MCAKGHSNKSIDCELQNNYDQSYSHSYADDNDKSYEDSFSEEENTGYNSGHLKGKQEGYKRGYVNRKKKQITTMAITTVVADKPTRKDSLCLT